MIVRSTGTGVWGGTGAVRNAATVETDKAAAPADGLNRYGAATLTAGHTRW
jgi:hypothetical protein